MPGRAGAKFTDMWNRLVDLGQAGEEILAAWIAKEELRTLLSLARTGASRHQISRRLWTFYQRCADTDIPELHRLARTIQAWWPQIEAFILTGITNAASEGVNRLIKLEARNAFGFRNPTNQRLRSRCASIRAFWRRTKPGQLRRPTYRGSVAVRCCAGFRPGATFRSWLPSVSRGYWSFPRLMRVRRVLAALKQTAFDRGCGPALIEGVGNGAKKDGSVGWRRRA